MNEELLKIIEAMEAAGESPEEIAKVVQAYDAPNIEKKNPITTAWATETGSSDTDTAQTEAGPSVSSDSQIEPEKPSRLERYVQWWKNQWKDDPVVGSVVDPEKENSKALQSGTARMVGGIVGIPEFFAKADLTVKFELAKMFGSDETKKKTIEIQNKLNALPKEQRDQAMLELQSATTPAKRILGIDTADFSKWSAETSSEIKSQQQAIDKTRKVYEGNIIDDIREGRLGQAGDRIANGVIESLPMMAMTIGTGGTGLAAMGGGVAADKLEEQEREGLDIDMSTVGSAGLRGSFEAVGGKVLQKMFKPVMGKVSPEQAAEITKTFMSRMKNAGFNFGKEFGEEAVQSLQEEITDALVKGELDEADWAQIAKNAVDGGLIGGVSTGPSNLIAAPQTDVVEDAAEAAPIDPQEAGQPVEIEPEGEVEAAPEAEAEIEPEMAPEQEVDNQEVADAENRVDEIDQAVEPDNEAVEDLGAFEKKVKAKMDKGDYIKSKEEKRTALILKKREADQQLTPEQAVAESKQAADKAREDMIVENKSELTGVEKTMNKFVDEFVDRQGSVKATLSKAGFKNTQDYMVTKLGASAAAKQQNDAINQKVYRGMSETEQQTFDEIVALRRIIAVDKSRSERGLAPVLHQGNQTSVSAKKALDGYKEQLGVDKFNELDAKADVLFDEYRNVLEDLRSEGMISQETFETFRDVDYQQTQFVKFLTDMENNFLAEELDAFEGAGLSQEQVKSMTTGSTGSQVMDSELLFKRTAIGRNKAKFSNRVNKAFASEFETAMETKKQLEGRKNLSKEERQQLRNLRELSKVVRPDKIVRFTKTGKPVYALKEAVKVGFKPIYYYEDGVPNRIYLREDFHSKFTDTNNQYINATTRKAAQNFSGTSLVKTMATGKNPLFFITNVPRDLGFAIAFSPELGSNVLGEGFRTVGNFLKQAGPRATPEWIAKKVNSKARLASDKKFQEYIKHGGGMDFLTLQGQQSSQLLADTKVGKAIGNNVVTKAAKPAWDWIIRGVDRVNETAEIAMRLTIYDRAIENRLKERGVNDISELSQEDQQQVYAQAVRAARELADFNQGGKLTKAGDAAIPYLNAAMQGTRAAAQMGFTKDGKVDARRSAETFFRITQMSAYATTATIAGALALIASNMSDEDKEQNKTNWDIYYETLEGVSEYDLRNYFVIPTGKRDSKGELEYYRVAKSQALTPALNLTESVARNYFAKEKGIDYQENTGENVFDAAYHNLMPIELNPFDAVSRIPIVDASYAAMGIDAYTGNPLDYERGTIDQSLEGKYDDRVEQTYKFLGEKMGVGPARLKGVVESIVTTPSTNPAVGVAYTIGDFATGGEDAFKNIDRTLGAGLKRIKKSTSEYNRLSKIQEKVSEDAIAAYDKHKRMKKDVRDAVREAKRSNNWEGVVQTLEDIYKEDPLMLEKAKKWGKAEYEAKKFAPLVNTLKYERNKEVRAIILAEQFGDALISDSPTFSEQEKKILKQLKEAKVLDSEVEAFYRRIVSE